MKFRVMGQRAQVFYVDVEAKDSRKAYDIANDSDSVKWIEVETDNVIEPIEVLEIANAD
jgi:hypothetical protein